MTGLDYAYPILIFGFYSTEVSIIGSVQQTDYFTLRNSQKPKFQITSVYLSSILKYLFLNRAATSSTWERIFASSIAVSLSR